MTALFPLLESPRVRLSRWAGAAVIVCAVHVGGAGLALMQWVEEEAEDAAGALTVEMTPLPAVARVDTPDLAHGPILQEHSTATPEASKKAIEEMAKDMPQLEPSPAPEPEVALPKQRLEEKEAPKEADVEEPSPEKQDAQQAQAASQAMAPRRVEAQDATGSAPPAPGKAPNPARVQASWQKRLVDHLNNHKQYPDAARNNRAQGTVVVAFELNRLGQIVASHVAKSSGSSALDHEALAVLKRASPLPAPPDLVAVAAVEWTLPIHFRIK